MSYAAEPYAQFVDDLLTALTGGVIREEFRFLPEEQPYRLRAPGPIVPASVRVFGQSGEAFHRFQPGKDYKFEQDFSITWLANAQQQPAARALWPDAGTRFYVNYEYTRTGDVQPPLTDRNPGSVTRLLAESFAREYAVLSRQLESIYKAAFVDTATGRDLDQIGVLVGIERRVASFAAGTVVFSRSTPAPGDIFIQAGTLVSSAAVPVVQFETRENATLRRGGLSVEVGIQASVSGPGGVVPAEAIQVINRPITGIEAAGNPQATGFQSATETDVQLRDRIKRAHQGSGKATVGSLLAALATIPGLREKDVQIQEDPVSRPGVIELNVALPELTAGLESTLLQQFSEQAVELIEESRPVGVRIVHNIDAPRPVGPGEAGPNSGADTNTDPVVTGRPPEGSLSLAVDVNAWLTPASRGLSVAEQSQLIHAGEEAVRSFIAEAGIGETLVYNRLVSQLMALPGVLDVTLEMFPQAGAGGPRRKNILPVNPGLRPVAGKIDIQLRGSLIVLDLVMTISPKGAGLLTDKLQLASTVGAEVTELLNQRLMTEGAPHLDQTALRAMLGTPQTYDIGSLEYTVEFQDAGVRVLRQNPSIEPSGSDQFWVRRVTVGVV